MTKVMPQGNREICPALARAYGFDLLVFRAFPCFCKSIPIDKTPPFRMKSGVKISFFVQKNKGEEALLNLRFLLE